MCDDAHPGRPAGAQLSHLTDRLATATPRHRRTLYSGVMSDDVWPLSTRLSADFRTVSLLVARRNAAGLTAVAAHRQSASALIGRSSTSATAQY